MDQEKLELRQSEIDTLIKLYTDQTTRDYNAFRLQKEQLVLLSHLSQQQSIEVLEVNLRLQQALDTTQIRLQKQIKDELLRNCGEMIGKAHPNAARPKSQIHQRLPSGDC
jgi:hypothetical protein